MQLKKYFLPLAIVVILLGSCTEKTEYRVPEGSLMGYIRYSFHRTHSYDVDHIGIKVTLVGSDPIRTVYTNSESMYLFENLYSGTYNILFEKEGYCSHIIQSYTFVGGKKVSVVPQMARLYMTPSITISNLRLSSNSYWDNTGNIEILANGVIDSEYPEKPRTFNYLRYFISNKPSVSYSDYLQTDIRTNMYLKDGEIDIRLRIDPTVFPIGTDIYVVVYPTYEHSENDYANRYLDLNTGLYIYSSIDFYRGSDVATIKVPDPDDNSLWW